MFIEIADLKTVSVPQVVSKVLNNDDTIEEEIISATIALMQSYLFGRFDVDAIFNATKNKDKVVGKYCKDIVIHKIYTR